MKKVALTVAVLALGLAACGSKTEEAMENANVENAVEADANAAVDTTADAANSADNALDAAGNAVENAADATANAADNAAKEIDNKM